MPFAASPSAHPASLERAVIVRQYVPEPLDVLHARYVTHHFAPHAHETYALGVCLEGAVATRHRGMRHVAGPGEVMLLNPGELHTGEPAHPDGWTHVMCYPSVALIRRVANELRGRPGAAPVLPAPLLCEPALAARVARLLQAPAHSGDLVRLDSALLGLLATLLGRHAGVAVRRLPLGGLHPAIRRVREYLHAHFTQRVTIADLSEVAGLSPFHLIRMFHARIGLPPYMYLEHLRVSLARTLLMAGVPIAEVASRTGFGDQSHFTRRFKRVVGVPPGRYIRQLRVA